MYAFWAIFGWLRETFPQPIHGVSGHPWGILRALWSAQEVHAAVWCGTVVRTAPAHNTNHSEQQECRGHSHHQLT
jgi:hypothetical protein